MSFPALGVPWIKAKVDTGARSSALHAFGPTIEERDGRSWVRFEIHPWQDSANDSIEVEAPVLEFRNIKSSSGTTQRRPIIKTTFGIGGHEMPIELTLARRDEMGFRLLLGREAVRRRFLVDPGRSYLFGQPPLEVRRMNRKADKL